MRADQFIVDSVSAPESSIFDLSHDLKTSLNMGNLYPVLVQDCIPGDMFKIRVENMFRLAPMLAPVMHKITITTHFFFVPNRILWDGWQNYITQNTPDVLHPFMETTPNESYEKELLDYLGMPTKTTFSLQFNPFAYSAYHKIFDEYYRDQNLVSEKFVPLVAGRNDLDSHAPVLRRAWMHDYFTSCLPFAQKGDAVSIPILDGGSIPVEMNTATGSQGFGYWKAFTDQNLSPSTGAITIDGSDNVISNTSQLLKFDPQGSLIINADQAVATINELRKAFALQEWLERQARGGTRYIEQIKAQFGVNSSDARLQRPEYIGGMKQNMVISEVLQTAGPSADIVTSVGDMYGHGISVGGSDTIKWFCEEHGIIMGILSVMPDTGYYQGLPRKYSRLDVFDYAWPSFAHLGEQEVLNKELLCEGPSPQWLDQTFGYIPRYSEYKFENNRVSGEFRSSLDYWHMARKFSDPPVLNEAFISAEPTSRIFVVDGNAVDHIYSHIFFNITASRKLPKFGTPMLIG